MSETEHPTVGEISLEDVQSAQLAAITEIRDAIHFFFHKVQIASPATNTLYRLVLFASERSQCISFLTSWGYNWDAEILLRSFTETCSKIWFICFTDLADQPELIEEFWHDLEQVHAHQQRQKSEVAYQLAREQSPHRDSPIFEALRDDQIFDFGSQNKKTRKQLKQKWSFSEIIDFLDKQGMKGAPTAGFRALAHMYGLQSHLIHGDNKALDLMMDEASREPQEAKLKWSSQVCRIMSDQLHFWLFCQWALATHFGREKNFAVFEPFLESFNSKSEVFRKAFYASQKNFYSRYD